MEIKRILVLGLGDLGSQVFDQLIHLPGNHRFLLGGRNVERIRQRSNVSVFAAMQVGLFPDVSCVSVDVSNIDQTASVIAQFRPDVLFCALALQPWMSIKALPASLYRRLYAAMAGPWLPWSLAPTYTLMQAVRQTGLPVKVINASYPDAVHAVLNTVGLAPTTGIGNLANNIPALKKSVALKLAVPVEAITLYFVAHHYASHMISRVGNTAGAPFHLTVLVEGKDVTHLLEREQLFDLLPTVFNRAGKGAGHLVTAASAAVVVEGVMNTTAVFTHAPGPNGLPGGYPIQIHTQGVDVVLPPELSLEAAIQINKAGLRLDGIERIENDGTVHFTEENMAILKEVLGYECQQMRLSEAEDWAKELRERYAALAQHH